MKVRCPNGIQGDTDDPGNLEDYPRLLDMIDFHGCNAILEQYCEEGES